MWVLGIESGRLEEQPVLLTTGLSPKSIFLIYYVIFKFIVSPFLFGNIDINIYPTPYTNSSNLAN